MDNLAAGWRGTATSQASGHGGNASATAVKNNRVASNRIWFTSPCAIRSAQVNCAATVQAPDESAPPREPATQVAPIVDTCSW